MMQPENTDLEVDIEISSLPWESKDPSIRKFYENDSPENKILDEIILREYELIEK